MHLNADRLARELEDELGIALRVSISSEAVAIDRLTPREQVHLGELATSPRRLSWLNGRSALKSLLNSLGEDEETERIAFPNSRFSLTHSGDFAVALGTASAELRGIGVDLEVNRPLRRETARFFLGEPEQAWVMSFDDSRRTKNLLRLWTIKEALFKSDPRNLERWFTDYRIEAPAANAGRAFVRGEEVQEFRYSCLEVEEGFLSVAVLPRSRHLGRDDFAETMKTVA
jgi:4'-phosphopantetheinyl transferase EntD